VHIEHRTAVELGAFVPGEIYFEVVAAIGLPEDHEEREETKNQYCFI
jgi:hypothetical protein